MIFIKSLEFYGWEDKMPNLIITPRCSTDERALYFELLEIFYRETTFKLNVLNGCELGGLSEKAKTRLRKLKIELGDWK
jgi:hypothetical protein